MRWIARTLVLFLLTMIALLLYQVDWYGKHYDGLVKQMIPIAGNSFFAGCMLGQEGNAARASLCRNKAIDFMRYLKEATRD